MAFLDSIRSLFSQPGLAARPVVAAPMTDYRVTPLTAKHSKEVLQLNLRCFKDGENYTKHTFAFLFNEPLSLSYKVVTAEGEIVAFVFVLTNADGTSHLTTIGVAPEHRRRGIAQMLLEHVERSLKEKGVSTLVLEVRVSNYGAISLYSRCGYNKVNRLERYYSDGEDCFMMLKSLI